MPLLTDLHRTLLSDVCSIEKGKQLNKELLFENGEFPVINGGINPSGFWNEYNYPKNSITISQGGASAGFVSWQLTNFWAGAHCYVITNSSPDLNYRYLYHVIKMNEFKLMNSQIGAGIPSLSMKDVGSIVIPIPPLKVQEEIVSILDTFTALTAELTAELIARKKQYEFYRDKLLSFDDLTPKQVERLGVRWMSFGELATIVRGASPRPIQSFITKDDDGINWIKIGDVSSGQKYITSCEEKITQAGALKSRFVHPGDFILSNSMSFGRPYILSIEGCIHDGWLSISDYEQFVSADYLYHLLNSSFIQHEMSQKASSGTVKNLNADIVKSLKLPIPSREYQDKITKILDHFDELCSNISQGLPAEIEARQKQYEHYRNKLLSFEEV